MEASSSSSSVNSMFLRLGPDCPHFGPDYSDAVLEAFRLFKNGYVYRGKRMVNGARQFDCSFG